MRSAALFFAGTLAGLAVNAGAQNETPNRPIIGLNHVGISVPDMDRAVEYYTKTMGFPEAFRFTSPAGQVVFVQVSKDTFLELLPVTAQRPAGITHLALQVENLAAAKDMFAQRGVAVGETINHSTGALLTSITDPNGNRVELVEFPPNSQPRQAIDRWR
jgi:catechol 2,3-dioxygenase-like lactoylglutathione lyase family enzyme